MILATALPSQVIKRTNQNNECESSPSTIKTLCKYKHEITAIVKYYLYGRQMDTYGFYILKSVHSFDHKVYSFQDNTEEKATYKEQAI